LGSQAKLHISSPVIILLKKFLSALAITIMSWWDVTRSSLCSGVKKCRIKRTHKFLWIHCIISTATFLRGTSAAFVLHFLPHQHQCRCCPYFKFSVIRIPFPRVSAFSPPPSTACTNLQL
jgi:hypothetical protein